MLLEPYSAADSHTCAFGSYAVLEALRHRPHAVTAVIHGEQLTGARLESLEAACRAAAVPLTLDRHTLARLRSRSDVEALAVVRKSERPLRSDSDHVLLVRPSQPGNLGTAIRSLVAFGFDELALVAPLVDAWSPHVVRASVGLRFAVSCQVFADEAAYLSACGVRTIYLFDAAAAAEIADVAFEPPFTLAFGPEGARGEPAGDAKWTCRWPGPAAAGAGPSSIGVRIASDRRAESLNLAVAVSLAAFTADRARRGREPAG